MFYCDWLDLAELKYGDILAVGGIGRGGGGEVGRTELWFLNS